MSSTHVSVEQGNNELTDRNTRSVRCIESSRGNDRVVFSVVSIDSFNSSFSDSLDSVREEVDVGFDQCFEISWSRSQTITEVRRSARDRAKKRLREQSLPSTSDGESRNELLGNMRFAR